MPTYPALRSQLVGTTAVKIGGYDVPENGATLVALMICNTLSTEVSVTVYTKLSSTTTHIAKDYPILPGKQLILDTSVNLASGEGIYVQSSDAASLDVHASLVAH
jgi:hypothetical protein